MTYASNSSSIPATSIELPPIESLDTSQTQAFSGQRTSFAQVAQAILNDPDIEVGSNSPPTQSQNLSSLAGPTEDPVTFDPLENAWVCSDRKTYNLKTLKKMARNAALADSSFTSPFTREPLRLIAPSQSNCQLDENSALPREVHENEIPQLVDPVELSRLSPNYRGSSEVPPVTPSSNSTQSTLCCATACVLAFGVIGLSAGMISSYILFKKI